MLSYSWNCLDEDHLSKISKSDYDSLQQLFARVLSNGCKHLIKRGLDRAYVDISQEYSGIKGKLKFAESLASNLFSLGKSISEFDEFEYNVLHNQIIKTTVAKLLKDKSLDAQTKADLKTSFQNLHKIDQVPINPLTFRKVQLHRNIKHYDLLLRVCRFIAENSTLDERTGDFTFREFQRDQRKMAVLFQSFVFNLLKREQSDFKVRGEEIEWDLNPLGGSNSFLLPRMRTDITLESEHEKIIIDTKFYPKTLSTNRFNKETFYSSDLYQIFSYLLNQERKGVGGRPSRCKGILLYPQTGQKLCERFKYRDHEIIIRTVNLANPWTTLKPELLDMIADI